MDSSNSAKARPSESSFDPRGVVVSIASVKLRNPTPASPRRSMMVSTSRRDRESRFEFLHHQHVVLSELIEKPVEFGPVLAPTRGLLAKDALAAGSGGDSGDRKRLVDRGADHRLSWSARMRRRRFEFSHSH